MSIRNLTVMLGYIPALLTARVITPRLTSGNRFPLRNGIGNEYP
jgi:hypothetical protein